MRTIELYTQNIIFNCGNIKDYNVMIHGKNFDFDQPVQSSVRRYANIRKIATGQQSMGSTDFEFQKRDPKL